MALLKLLVLKYISLKFVPPTISDTTCIVGAVIVPVKLAPDRLAFKVIADETALDIGNPLGLVLATFPNPSVAAVIDETSPELRIITQFVSSE